MKDASMAVSGDTNDNRQSELLISVLDVEFLPKDCEE